VTILVPREEETKYPKTTTQRTNHDDDEKKKRVQVIGSDPMLRRKAVSEIETLVLIARWKNKEKRTKLSQQYVPVSIKRATLGIQQTREQQLNLNRQLQRQRASRTLTTRSRSGENKKAFDAMKVMDGRSDDERKTLDGSKLTSSTDSREEKKKTVEGGDKKLTSRRSDEKKPLDGGDGVGKNSTLLPGVPKCLNEFLDSNFIKQPHTLRSQANVNRDDEPTTGGDDEFNTVS
jgi:phage shock protein A